MSGTYSSIYMVNLYISFKMSIVRDIMVVCRSVDDITVSHNDADESKERK